MVLLISSAWRCSMVLLEDDVVIHHYRPAFSVICILKRGIAPRR